MLSRNDRYVLGITGRVDSLCSKTSWGSWSHLALYEFLPSAICYDVPMRRFVEVYALLKFDE